MQIPAGIRQHLDPEDQALVDATVTSPATPSSSTSSSSSRSKAPLPYEKPRVRATVTWLRKTSYLTSEDDLPQFKAKGVEAAPSKYKLQRAGQPEANTLENQVYSRFIFLCCFYYLLFILLFISCYLFTFSVLFFFSVLSILMGF